MSEKMIEENYAWDQYDHEHDDYYTAEDYECKEYYLNGWDQSKYDRQRWQVNGEQGENPLQFDTLCSIRHHSVS